MTQGTQVRQWICDDSLSAGIWEAISMQRNLIMGKTHLFIWECKILLGVADQYLE